MSDERNNIESDLLMRSILDGAQEEVPAGVWEGVSAGLDKMARKKVAVLWWRRTAVGTAVAAAAAALFFMIGHEGETMDLVPENDGSGMIAVVESEIVQDTAEAPVIEKTYVAYAAPAAVAKSVEVQTAAEPAEMQIMVYDPAEVHTTAEPEAMDQAKSVQTAVETTAYQAEDWDLLEEEPVKKKINTSFVLSGLTGTNSNQNSMRKNLIKRPSLSQGPARTGVSETSTNSTYRIPLSFGAGVMIDLGEKWSLGTGLNYSMLSRSFFGTYTKVDKNGLIESSTASDIRNTQHFIGIPINAYYTILENKSVNFYAYAGGMVEKCITDKYDVLSTSIVHKEQPQGVQLSADAGIGVQFMLGRHLGLYIDPSLRYYFNCGQPKSIRTMQPLMLGFEMGLRVKL